MKIILCSTQDSVRDRWRSILQKYDYSLYQASSPQMLKSMIRQKEEILFLIHQTFMDLQSISLVCQVSNTFKVFVLADSPTKEAGIALLQRGVVGYANTYISEGRLMQVIKTIKSGQVWFSQEVLAEFIKAVHASQKSDVYGETEKLLKNLTEREREIAILVARGLSNKAIGEQLYISERTVKTHLGSIFAKTGVNSRLKLALLIRE